MQISLLLKLIFFSAFIILFKKIVLPIFSKLSKWLSDLNIDILKKCSYKNIYFRVKDEPKISEKDYEDAIKENNIKRLISLFINDECNEIECCNKIVCYHILKHSIELYNDKNKNKAKLNCVYNCIKKILNYNAIKRKDKKELISLIINDERNSMESYIKLVKYKILKHSIELYNYFYDKNKIQLNNCIESIKKILNNNVLSFEKIFSEEHMLLLIKSNEIVKGISDITRLIINLAIEKHCIIKDNNNNKSSRSYDIPKIIYIINMAIKVNDIRIVKYLLEEWDNESNININCKDMYGNYFILNSMNSDEIFKYFLEKGIGIKKIIKKQLISLISSYKPYLLNTLLLQENVPINEKYGNEDYPLIKAIKRGDYKSVISLVIYGRKHGYDLNVDDVDGNGALIISYNLKNEENEKIFKYLINNLNINKKDSNGYTILYYILVKQDIETFKLLLGRIRFDNIDKENNSIFHIIINKKLNTMLDYFINEFNQNNNYLIHKTKKIINRLNKNGETCISILIRSNNFSIKEIKECLPQLKNLGADINKMDKQKNKTIAYVINDINYDLFDVLIKNGIRIDESIVERIFDTNDKILIDTIINCGVRIDSTILKKIIDNNNITVFQQLMDSDAHKKLFNVKDKMDFLKYITKQILDYEHNQNDKDSNITDYKDMFKYLVCHFSSNSELSLIYESKVIDMVNKSGDLELLEILKENKVHLLFEKHDNSLNYINNCTSFIDSTIDSNNPANTESKNSNGIKIRTMWSNSISLDGSNSNNNNTFFINSSSSITLEEHEEFINRRIGI